MLEFLCFVSFSRKEIRFIHIPMNFTICLFGSVFAGIFRNTAKNILTSLKISGIFSIKGMIMRRMKIVMLALLSLWGVWLTATEFEDLKQIRIAIDDNYPPYIFRNDQGELQGITFDLWKLWEKKTGIKVVFFATDWNKAKESFNNGHADILETLFYTKERAKIYQYSRPYAEIRVPIFYKNELTGIRSVNDLKGFTIGVKSGDAVIDMLRSKGIVGIVEYNSYEDIIKAVAKNEIHIFSIDEPPALYYLYKYKLLNKYKFAFNLYTGHFHRAVLKKNAYLMEVVENGFDLITKKEMDEVQERWKGQFITSFNLKKLLPFIITFAIIVVFVILLLFTNSYYLNKKIKQKTLLLQQVVNDLKESEARNKAFLNAIPNLMFIFDVNGNFIDYKGNKDEEFYVPPGFFIGKNIKDVLPPDVARMTLEKIEKVKTSKQTQTYEYSLTLKNKEEHYEAQMAVCGENEFLAIVQNITYKKMFDSQRLRSNKLESLGQLAGGIAHDFNNILTAVIGSLSMIKLKAGKGSVIYELADTAEKSGFRAKNLTNQLLTFAKGGSPVKDTANMNAIVTDASDFVLRGSNCICEYDLEKNLRLTKADAGQLTQVIQNIVINAYQSMPNGGKIFIKTANVKFEKDNPLSLNEGEYNHIQIADQGYGISEENMEHIFDPYFTTRTGGSGLGLTICYSVIKKHNGTISIESVVNKGTEVNIYLPAEITESESKMETIIKEEPISNERKQLVLLMDDEDQIRFIGKEMLEYLGFDVLLSEDGEDTINQIRSCKEKNTPVDIVIMDLTIPGKLGGKEAIVKIRDFDQNIKAIVTSGYSNDPVMSNYTQYGFNNFLIKPFDIEMLSKALS